MSRAAQRRPSAKRSPVLPILLAGIAALVAVFLATSSDDDGPAMADPADRTAPSPAGPEIRGAGAMARDAGSSHG